MWSCCWDSLAVIVWETCYFPTAGRMTLLLWKGRQSFHWLKLWSSFLYSSRLNFLGRARSRASRGCVCVLRSDIKIPVQLKNWRVIPNTETCCFFQFEVACLCLPSCNQHWCEFFWNCSSKDGEIRTFPCKRAPGAHTHCPAVQRSNL